jgi:PAS domain S-box-containing protein
VSQDAQAAARQALAAADPVALDLLQATLLGDAVDHGPMLLFVADDEMHYLAVNRRACDVLGYSREELLALRVTDVASEPTAHGLYRSMLQTGAQRGVTALRRKDGEQLTYYYWAQECTTGGVPAWVSIGLLADELPLLTG